MEDLPLNLMNAATKFVLVLVTAPSLKVARDLAGDALKANLIACANLIPQIESHYRWQGKIERAPEVMLILKTTSTRAGLLEKLILAKHPYDTPEFIVLKVAHGNKRYLNWLAESVR
jgi:periplasmic divalent cation tolerance protein